MSANESIEGGETPHRVAAAEAVASQFYIAEVITVDSADGADEGDVELLLNSSRFDDGDVHTGRSFGGEVPPKEWEIVAGPFDCPPMPHVLALKAWFREEQPADAWAVYSETQSGRGSV